jgi:hypothetical protein
LGTSFKISGVMSALYPQESVKTEIALPDKKIIIKSFDSLYEIKADSAYFSRLMPNEFFNAGRVWDAKVEDGKLVTLEEKIAQTEYKLDSVKLNFILSSDESFVNGKNKYLLRFSSDGQDIFLVKNNLVIEKWQLNPEKPKIIGFAIKDLFDFFLVFVIFAGISSIILFVLVKPLLKMMHGVR